MMFISIIVTGKSLTGKYVIPQKLSLAINRIWRHATTMVVNGLFGLPLIFLSVMGRGLSVAFRD